LKTTARTANAKYIDYLLDDVHSVTTGGAFVRLYFRIVFVHFVFYLLERKAREALVKFLGKHKIVVRKI
jgi:hypothetical protein